MRASRQLAAWIAAVCLAGAWLVQAPGAAASPTQESIFQDDTLLVYHPRSAVDRTLARMAALGAQRVRVTLKWADVAPDALSRRRPHGFGRGARSATDPASYPASGWAPYDNLVELAARHDIAVQFNISAPGPLWAMGGSAPDAHSANHWKPSVSDFYLFALAAGKRYSGFYHGLPRVSFWSIWNEPDQSGWLAPQYERVGRRIVLSSAVRYRQLAVVTYAALYFTGHSTRTDTILIGETAPKGSALRVALKPSSPLPFLRALYCVDTRFAPLRGTAARELGCPTGGSVSSFVAAQPDLFYATGFAHHPYYLNTPPGVRSTNPNNAPLGDLDHLEQWLDRSLRAYGVRRQLPIYFTEFGYQSNPPDPFAPNTLAQQAEYINASDYIAYRNPRVRSVAQFLLEDDRGDAHYHRGSYQYWETFQTGLLFAGGGVKPAMAAYRIPIWLPHSVLRRGHSLLVWGQIRPAGRVGPQTAAVQWRAATRGSWRTLAFRDTSEAGFLEVVVRPPGSGLMRILWRPDGGAALSSRSAPVSVR